MSTVAPGSEPALRALVVDDEVPLADVVASYLEREMFEVHGAHDGQHALDLAREIDPHVVAPTSVCPVSTASRFADNFACSPTPTSSC